MKFGSSLKMVAALPLLAGALGANAEPLYFFGNAPDANSSVPVCPDLTASTCAPLLARSVFSDAVVTRATEAFAGTSPSVNLGDGSLSVFGGLGTLTQSVPFPDGYSGAQLRTGAPSNGRFDTTGGTGPRSWLQTDWEMTLQLSTSVGAFGFYGTDFGDFDGGLKIAIYRDGVLIDDNIFTANGNNTPLETRVDNQTVQDGSLLFFGYASEQLFDKIVFTIGQAPSTLDVLGFDDLVIGNLRTTTPNPNPVPEPGSLALVGLALAAAGLMRRRKA